MAICYPLNAKRGITLIELLIAISLVGMIVLAIVAVDVAARRFVNTSDFEARAQNQASPALELIAKDVSQAVGNRISDTGVNQTSAANIGARVDINSTGGPNNTPGNYGDDTWISYSFDAGTSTIRRKQCLSNAWPCVATASDSTVATSIVAPTNFTIAVDGSVKMIVSAQLTERDNTTVTLETTVFPRSNSAN